MSAPTGISRTVQRLVASCDMQSQSIRILVIIRTTARRFPRCRLNAHSRFEKLSVRETKGRHLRATGASILTSST
jgi:hypothetical protein